MFDFDEYLEQAGHGLFFVFVFPLLFLALVFVSPFALVGLAMKKLRVPMPPY